MTKSQEVSCVGRGTRGRGWGEAMVAIASGRSLGMGVRLEGRERRNAGDSDPQEVGWGEAERTMHQKEAMCTHMHRHTWVAGSQATIPIQERLQTSTFPHLCHLQQEGIHNIACRARGVQAPLVPLHLLNGEGGQGAHMAEELGLGAWEALQEPGEHLIGLRGRRAAVSMGPGPASRWRGRGMGCSGGYLEEGGRNVWGKVVGEGSHGLPGPKGS